MNPPLSRNWRRSYQGIPHRSWPDRARWSSVKFRVERGDDAGRKRVFNRAVGHWVAAPTEETNMTHTLTTRRGVLSGAAATSALIASGSFKAHAADTVVGFIYVGSRADFGWNQSHAVAAAALKQIPGMKVVEEENVPEPAAVAKTMESLITLDGASLIFGTSFGYFDPFMIDMAREFPKVQFRHPT